MQSLGFRTTQELNLVDPAIKFIQFNYGDLGNTPSPLTQAL